jgi:flagellar biosynthetic protein FliR
MSEMLNELPLFLLILIRVASFFAVIPIFSYRNIPTSHKIGLSVFLSWAMLYTMESQIIEINGTYFMLVIKEALVGLSIGFIAAILLYALQVAGGFIDLQMGFAIANVFDPQTGLQTPLIGRYFYTIAIMFLLAVDAHHMLLDGIFNSYQFIPIEEWETVFGRGSVVEHIVSTFNTMFIIAFQMALPIVGCLFLVDLALGIIARTVPQVNVFIVGLPLKIGVSFVVLLLVLPVFFMLVEQLFSEITKAMRVLMKLLGGV